MFKKLAYILAKKILTKLKYFNYGFPLFAEGQAGALYFFNLLASISLPTFVGLNYNLIFHFWLIGFFLIK